MLESIRIKVLPLLFLSVLMLFQDEPVRAQDSTPDYLNSALPV